MTSAALALATRARTGDAIDCERTLDLAALAQVGRGDRIEVQRVVDRTLALFERTLELVDRRVEAGLAPGLDRVRARAAVARLEAEVGPLQTEIQRSHNAIAVLYQSTGTLLERNNIEFESEGP